MNPEDGKKLVGITPDINNDYIDPTQLTEDLLYYYNLIKTNKLDTKKTNLSKQFYLRDQYNRLISKSENGILSENEQKFLTYLKTKINGR